MPDLMQDLVVRFAWMFDPTVLARQTLAGVSNGMLLFLISAGVALIFGVQRILNFAHGVLFMVGAFVAVTLSQMLGESFAMFLLVLTGSVVALTLLGAAIEWGLLRKIYNAPHEFQLLMTFALVFILGDLVKLLWGNEDRSMSSPALLSGSSKALGVVFPTYRLFLIAVGVVVAIGLWLLLHKTRWGKFIRAATDDRAMLGALGVNTRWLYTSVFALGTALSGLGGALAAPVVSVGPGLHVQVIIDAFVVVVIGGMGSVVGALVASLLVGLINAYGILAFPGWSMVLTFLCMAVVLIVRPWGLFGSPE
ncbi:MAG: branched-chain amino acid ABC transporter permease [Burkholderiaceae bacterium]